VQKVTYDISKPMTATPQASIQELGSQHGIDEWSLDQQTCLAEKFEVKLGIVKDFDESGRGEELT